MYDVLRFWLDRGVDGFRVDVLWLLIKDDQYRDNPPNPRYELGESSGNSLIPLYNSNRPEVHDVVAEMRSVIDRYPERVLIGEVYLPLKELMTYYGQELRGANLPFNFLLLQCLECGSRRKGNLRLCRRVTGGRVAKLGVGKS